MSSGLCGSYAPSLHSRMTVPLSRTSTPCHWPMGMQSATQSEPGARSMTSVTSGFHMSMNGQRRTRLDGIEHPLRPVGRGIPEVQVHPQSRRNLRLGSEIVKDVFINNHDTDIEL